MSPYAEAWHEAGHGVVAHLCGGRVRQLSLEDEEQGGRADIEWSGLDEVALARQSAAVALAGPLAEALFRDEGFLEEPGLHAAWRADDAEIDRSLALLEPRASERESLRQKLFDQVQALLEPPEVQAAVARVADALDAHGTLDEGLFEEALALEP